MKAIQGFVTDDGEFFEDKAEADLHERMITMKAVLKEDDMSEDVLDWIMKRQKEIGNFLNFGAQVNARRYIRDSKKPG